MLTVSPLPTPPGRSLVALLVVVPAPVLGVLAAMVLWPGPVGETIFALAKGWMLVAPLAWRKLIDRQPLSLSPARAGGFGPAVGLGLVMLGVIVGAYALLGSRLIDVTHVRAMADQNGIGTPARFLGLAAYWILLNSVLEEYVYRWFVFEKLESMMSPRLAVLGSAACFTLHHVIALKVQFDWTVTVIASVGIFIGGTVWSWLYLRYRSVWPCYASHAIVDVAVFAIGWWVIFG